MVTIEREKNYVNIEQVCFRTVSKQADFCKNQNLTLMDEQRTTENENRLIQMSNSQRQL